MTDYCISTTHRARSSQIRTVFFLFHGPYLTSSYLSLSLSLTVHSHFSLRRLYYIKLLLFLSITAAYAVNTICLMQFFYNFIIYTLHNPIKYFTKLIIFINQTQQDIQMLHNYHEEKYKLSRTPLLNNLITNSKSMSFIFI